MCGFMFCVVCVFLFLFPILFMFKFVCLFAPYRNRMKMNYKIVIYLFTRIKFKRVHYMCVILPKTMD